MVTIAHLVENIVEKKPFLEEALSRGVINYVAYAEELKPELEKELKKKIKTSAIMMALRRLAEKLEKVFLKKAEIKFKETDTTIKSDLFEITIPKSETSINNIRKIYDIVDFSKGDFLTITHGLYEITIISNQKYKNKIEKILENEKITKIISDLSALTIKIPIEMISIVGPFYLITKTLNWENINIIEIVSTLTEMTFIIKEEDTSKAFNSIKRLIRRY